MHPGGKKALENYIFKDITDILFRVYPHKKEETLSKLAKYKIGEIKGRPENKSKVLSKPLP